MNEKPSVEQLITAAAKQYVEETNNEMPSLIHSTVAAANQNTEVVILRDNNSRIVAHYQHLGGLKFLRIDKTV